MKRIYSFDIPKYIKTLLGTRSADQFIADLGLEVKKQSVYAWIKGDYLPTPENLKKLGIRVVYEVKG